MDAYIADLWMLLGTGLGYIARAILITLNAAVITAAAFLIIIKIMAK